MRSDKSRSWWARRRTRARRLQRRVKTIRVVQVPAIPVHPGLIERYERERAEMERMLGPEAMARIDAAEAEAMRCFIEGIEPWR